MRRYFIVGSRIDELLRLACLPFLPTKLARLRCVLVAHCVELIRYGQIKALPRELRVLSKHAAELVALPSDVILATGSPVVRSGRCPIRSVTASSRLWRGGAATRPDLGYPPELAHEDRAEKEKPPAR